MGDILADFQTGPTVGVGEPAPPGRGAYADHPQIVVLAPSSARGMPPCGELPPSRSADRHAARNALDRLSWALPGRGEALEGCGAPILMGCFAVDAKGHGGKVYVAQRAHSCERRECPTCYKSWAGKEGRRAARRMAYGVGLLGEGLPVHVVVSPPQDAPYAMAGDYRRLRSTAVRALKAVGYLGGSLVFHPWRCQDKDGNRVGGMLLQDGGTAVDGPHFHATCTGWNDDPAALYRRTGWVVHRIRALADQDDIAHVLVYALTHAGIGKNLVSGGSLEALTWWGSFATCKLKLPEEPEADLDDVCPLCEGPLQKAVWLGLGDPPPKGGLVHPDDVRADFGAFLDDVRRTVRRDMKAREYDETDWWSLSSRLKKEIREALRP